MWYPLDKAVAAALTSPLMSLATLLEPESTFISSSCWTNKSDELAGGPVNGYAYWSTSPMLPEETYDVSPSGGTSETSDQFVPASGVQATAPFAVGAIAYSLSAPRKVVFGATEQSSI